MKKKVNWQLVVAGILMLILGILCILYPAATLELVTIFAGVAFIVAGIMGIATYAKTKDLFPLSSWQIVHSILDLILGLLFLAQPYIAGAAMVWVFAFLLIPLGIFEIVVSFREKGFGVSQWGWTLVSGILTIILGCLFIIDPAGFAYLLGFALIVEAITVMEAGFIIGKLGR